MGKFVPNSLKSDARIREHWQDNFATERSLNMGSTMIGSTISHYTILEKIGEGGMGIVYKARDLTLDRLVALKFLPPNLLRSSDDVARFEREAKAISALNHPNVATIYSCEQEGGQRFLAFEFLPGGTLKEQIKQLTAAGQQLSLAEITDYGLQIAAGLACAHQHGIIHRDVKTDNVLLTEDGKIKLTDFGLAKFKGASDVTKTGSTLGTPSYMSPEQIRGENVDGRSDIFSFGVVLYELATGHLPFRGEHEAAINYSIVNEEPIPITAERRDLPDTLQELIRRCLEKDRDKRPQNFDEAITALHQAQQGDTGKHRRPRKHSTIIRRIAIAALIVACLFVAYVFVPKGKVSAEKKSIAVLPFKNLSGNQQDDYFSDGMTEDIIAQLSKVSDLKVISRTSVMRYKNVEENIRDVAKELGVSTILEGSVRRGDNQVRIVAELIDAATDDHLWGETYDKEMTQIFAIQSDVARHISAALQAKLTPTELRRIGKSPTENLAAYDYYLKGREYYYQYRDADNETAIEFFKQALALDPNYALAYAGLADAYSQRAGRFGHPAFWTDSAVAVSKLSLTLDHDLAEGYKALGFAMAGRGQHRRALEAYGTAIKINPNYALAAGNLGWTNLYVGELAQAAIWLKQSLVLDPLVPSESNVSIRLNSYALGMTYALLDDTAKAFQRFREAVEYQPENAAAYVGLAYLYLRTGDSRQTEEYSRKVLSLNANDIDGLALAGDVALFTGDLNRARKYYEKAVSVDISTVPWITGIANTTSLGYVYLKLGQPDKARELFAQSLMLDQEGIARGNEWYYIPFDLAIVNANQADKKEACRWLQKAIDAGWRDYLLALKDPRLESLRGNKDFMQLMNLVKSKVEGMGKDAERQQK